MLGKASTVSKKHKSTLGSVDDEDSDFSEDEKELKHDDDVSRW